jgi:hypothetical protein
MSRVGTYRGKDRTWWTRSRVIDGMRRFHSDTGQVPLSTEVWHHMTAGLGKDPTRRRYPSFYGVLRYFRSFREAWQACGVHTNRTHENWSEIEDWYLHEAAGLLSRNQIACDLNRTPNAVHRRLYDLGIHSYRAQGWTLFRLQKATGVRYDLFRKYLDRGLVPFVRGSKCLYVDPADFLVAKEIDWASVDRELEGAVRRSLVGRLMAVLSAAQRREPWSESGPDVTENWGHGAPGERPVIADVRA